MAEHVLEYAESLIEQARRVIERLGNSDQKSTFTANVMAKFRGERQESHHIGLAETKAAQESEPSNETEPPQEQTGPTKLAKGKLFDEPIGAEPIPSRKAATDEDFEKFWKPYPRKVNKAKAREAFNRAFKKLRARMDADDVVRTIVDGAKVYAEKANPEALCHPTTWLNGERWDDDPNGIATPSLSPSRNRITGGHVERKPQTGKFDPELRPKLTLEEKIRRARGK